MTGSDQETRVRRLEEDSGDATLVLPRIERIIVDADRRPLHRVVRDEKGRLQRAPLSTRECSDDANF